MEKIKAKLILEIIGRPPEHIVQALEELVKRMSSEKGIKIVDKKTHKPKKIKESENLYSSFSEIDAEFENVEFFFAILMGYLPSNVEIYEPEKFKVGSHELNSLGNYIVTRLHKYDEITKRVISERDILYHRLQEIFPGKSIEEIMQIKSEKNTVNRVKKTKKKKSN